MSYSRLHHVCVNLCYNFRVVRGSLKKYSGFTLVETLIGVSIFVVLVVAVYSAYTAVYDVIADSRFKISAIDLANEQLELARNVPYGSVGVVGGLPAGVFPYRS